MRPTLFKPGRNCWRTSRISHGTLLVDCADFYRALHSAIVKAKRRIIIVGWDIDSRIRLLRGDDEKNAATPSKAGELLAWKARENPGIEIYLLRWDSSVTFMGQRELLAERVWEFITPPNVHVWLDSTISAGGSHHQKIILIDDEVAFTGGMDIAPQRWDERAHRPVEPERYDDDGAYTPYHDIQIVLHGPVVADLGALARWRWEHAADYEIPLPSRRAQLSGKTLPQCWPDGFDPGFVNMDCAIARTIPWMGKHPEVYEVRQMYLDMIDAAQEFIYIENQFLADEVIAQALNRRLRENEALKLLIVSSYNPQGLFEREALWALRIDFKRKLEEGVAPQRVKMAYPIVYDAQGAAFPKRIHAKIFAVDDRYFTVGSANINHRSMSLDTECDLIIAARTAEERQVLAHTRNDLICEHSGKTEAEIEKIIAGKPVRAFLHRPGKNVCRLHEIDDAVFAPHALHRIAVRLADPADPLLPSVYSLNPGEVRPMKNPKKHVLVFSVLFMVLAIAGISYISTHTEWITAENVEAFLYSARGTLWGLPLVCAIYVLAGFVMFPVTVLSLATAAVFGAVLGPLYAMCGALLSAAVLFWVGELVGMKWLRKLFGEVAQKIDRKMHAQGVLGVAAVRMVPIAPFSLVNLVAGISSIRFWDFIAGSFLGLLPGLVAKGLIGDSLAQLVLNPSADTIAYLGVGIVVWIILLIGAQKLVRRYAPQKKEV